YTLKAKTITYDHRIMSTELPVRSAVLKHDTGGLVVRWVTTGEYLLLYVFAVFADFFFLCRKESNYRGKVEKGRYMEVLSSVDLAMFNIWGGFKSRGH
ncbi:hypothetical protein P280DRAFT_409808, partial [Massarina eburnea CBS 473.64]